MLQLDLVRIGTNRIITSNKNNNHNNTCKRPKIYHPIRKHSYNNRFGPRHFNSFTLHTIMQTFMIKTTIIPTQIFSPPAPPINKFKSTTCALLRPLLLTQHKAPHVDPYFTHQNTSCNIASPPSFNYPTQITSW